MFKKENKTKTKYLDFIVNLFYNLNLDYKPILSKPKQNLPKLETSSCMHTVLNNGQTSANVS